jgi:hypothetical protein
MARALRVQGKDLRAIAFGSEKVWKCTLKRLGGLVRVKH